jgi:hypothetical protein
LLLEWDFVVFNIKEKFFRVQKECQSLPNAKVVRRVVKPGNRLVLQLSAFASLKETLFFLQVDAQITVIMEAVGTCKCALEAMAIISYIFEI